MRTECGKTFPEPPLFLVTKNMRKEKKGKELRLPFGTRAGCCKRSWEEPSLLSVWTIPSRPNCSQAGHGKPAAVPGEVGGVQGTTVGQSMALCRRR